MAEMAGLGDKTPVSCLQEYLVSKQLFPQYELIHNGVGTHNPLFVYRVLAGGFLEEGSGRSKREAKHKAAEKMLKTLKIIDSTEDENSEQVLREPAENFVGDLKELCLIQCYPEPKYYLEEAAGPPHSRIFRMICCVSQLQDHGTSTTKKQAKQQAAWKMLQRLKELKGNMSDESSLKTEIKCDAVKVQQTKRLSVSDDEIIAKYNTLRPTAVSTVNKDPAVLYKDHHKAYVGLPKTSATLANILNGTIKINKENSLNLLNDIAQELEVTLINSKVPSVYPQVSFVIITMTVFPSIAGVGDTNQEAAINLLDSLLFLCNNYT